MGVLSHFDNSVTLVNRTIGGKEFERDLSCRFDGEDVILKPGDNPGFPRVAVPYAKRQNPLMGSKHPRNPSRFVSLVGAKEMGDDVAPLAYAVLRAEAEHLEVIDRSGEYYGEPLRKVQLHKKTRFDQYDAQIGADQAGGDFNRNIE